VGGATADRINYWGYMTTQFFAPNREYLCTDTNSCTYVAGEQVTKFKDMVKAMHAQFTRRRAYVMERVEALPGVHCVPPGGAFYAFMNVSEQFGRTLGGRAVANSTDFCLTELASAHVALVMGSAFGAEGYARLSFATSLETLEKGFDALERFLSG